jgi:Fe-S cluster assembly protein SufB
MSHNFCKGLSQDIIKRISGLRGEPGWLLDYRLKAYKKWQSMSEPHWSTNHYQPIDYQDIIYYTTPTINPFTGKEKGQEMDQTTRQKLTKLGIPIKEQDRFENLAMDAVVDSTSLFISHQKLLKAQGIIFCSIREAVLNYPDLVKKYLGSVVPFTDNFFACLNSAVFSDGTFVYVPAGVTCPIDLSTYFRINTQGSGQFERTLIIAEEGSSVNYLEGCTAEEFKDYQLHAAVVEIVSMDRAVVNYSTVQNWYAGDFKGQGGVYNFVTKRGIAKGFGSKISWTQVETGSSITWKYPSVILKGDESVGEFYSVSYTQNHQQADTGTKMTHIGKNTRSKIISKSISDGQSGNTFRSLVKVAASADGAYNFSQCDSLILSPDSVTQTLPTVEIKNPTAVVEQEAFSSSISRQVREYLAGRGFSEELVTQLTVGGYTREILKLLPMEFVIEARKLIEMKLEGSVG